MDATKPITTAAGDLSPGGVYDLALRHGETFEQELKGATITAWVQRDRHCPTCSCNPEELRYQAETTDQTVGFQPENVIRAERID